MGGALGHDLRGLGIGRADDRPAVAGHTWETLCYRNSGNSAVHFDSSRAWCPRAAGPGQSDDRADELWRNRAPGLADRDLTVDVLGPPRVRWDERVASFRTRRGLALLVYLALTGAAQPRERLAALLWPDRDADVGPRPPASSPQPPTPQPCRRRADTPESLTAISAGRDTFGREVVGLARTPSLASRSTPTDWRWPRPLGHPRAPPAELAVAAATYRARSSRGWHSTNHRARGVGRRAAEPTGSGKPRQSSRASPAPSLASAPLRRPWPPDAAGWASTP